jgi:hypothetical protein
VLYTCVWVAQAQQFDQKLYQSLRWRSIGPFRAGGGGAEPWFARLATEFKAVMGIAEGADAAPTTQAIAAYNQSRKSLGDMVARWNEIKTREVSDLNEKLRQANLQPLTVR